MNVLCPTNECQVLLNSKCVFYGGEILSPLDINTNDDLETILVKINDYVSNGTGTSIQFQNQGVNLGNNQANTVNFTGSGVTASRTGDTVTVNISSGFVNPMTNPGDLIVGGFGGSAQRLGIGAPFQQLRVNSSGTALEYFTSGNGVVSVSSGNLTPLFTTSVSNPTTTPLLSFTLSNAGANTYFGNSTGSSAAPSYTAAGALTKFDDTNVTLTLGGNPATSLLRAVSLTLGWTGVLSIARGGTGLSSLGSPLQSIRVNAGGTALEYYTPSGGGGVSSVDVSGGTTGLTTSGGPITTSGTITLGGILSINNGGTGATSAVNARTNLGLTIGTDVQGFSLTLAALSTYNTNGILTQTALNTFTGRTLTGTVNQITVVNGNGVSGNPTVSLPADVVIPTVLTVPNTGLHILDTNASHDLIVIAGSDLTSDRNLTIITGDANRILSLGSDFVLPADPNDDRILFWDDSATSTAYLAPDSTLAIVNTTIGIPLATYTSGQWSYTGLSDAAGDYTMRWFNLSGNLIGGFRNDQVLELGGSQFIIEPNNSVTSGNARIRLNDNQAMGLIVEDKVASKEYISFRTTDNDERFNIRIRYRHDTIPGNLYPTDFDQAQGTSPATNSTTTLITSIPMSTNEELVKIEAEWTFISNAGTGGWGHVVNAVQRTSGGTVQDFAGGQVQLYAVKRTAGDFVLNLVADDTNKRINVNFVSSSSAAFAGTVSVNLRWSRVLEPV